MAVVRRVDVCMIHARLIIGLAWYTAYAGGRLTWPLPWLVLAWAVYVLTGDMRDAVLSRKNNKFIVYV